MLEEVTVLDLTAIKQRQQQMWAAGDFAMVATSTIMVGELLCESLDLRSGQNVLDVATGSGNTALAAARRWCSVTGIDFVPSLLERARERAACERLEISFQEGDTESIPFADASFDVVLSTFGAMFGPDQEKVASELLRACRRGGKIGMANWTPDSFVGETNRIAARYVPPPPDLKPPLLWGTEARLRELFGDGITSLQATRRSFVFRFRSEQHWLDFHRSYLGPVRQVFESLDSTQQEQLSRDAIEVVRRFNRSGDETVVAPSDYLEVVAIRRYFRPWVWDAVRGRAALLQPESIRA
jgi:SAM-dependent methyltransferase